MNPGSTQPLVKMSTRNIPGGKGDRCVRLTTYRHIVPLSRNLGALAFQNPLGLFRPVRGQLYIFTIMVAVTNQEKKNSARVSQIRQQTVRSTSCVTWATDRVVKWTANSGQLTGRNATCVLQFQSYGKLTGWQSEADVFASFRVLCPNTWDNFMNLYCAFCCIQCINQQNALSKTQNTIHVKSQMLHVWAPSCHTQGVY